MNIQIFGKGKCVEPAPFQQTHILPVMVAEQHHHCRNRQDHQNQFFPVRYQKSGKIKWKPATVSAVFSLCGASIGAQINLRLDPLFLKKLVLVIRGS